MNDPKKNIPWWQTEFDASEKELIAQVFAKNYLNEGEFTDAFEQELARLLKVKHAIAVTSGTSALYLALAGLGVGAGDEVLVPDVTFIATANAVSLTGAKPILVDVQSATLLMDPERLEKAITPRTRAILPVHLSGRPAALSSLLEIAKRHQLFVVEDTAQAMMSQMKGKCLGTFGNAGCLSFSPHKIITTGQGGAVITNDDDLHQNIRALKDQGRAKRGTGGDDLHPAIGYNFKFTNLQAAVGLGQLKKLPRRIDRLKANHAIYQRRLAEIIGIRLFPVHLNEGELPLWTDALTGERDALEQYLRERQIDCRRFYFPLHRQKAYAKGDEAFPQSTRLTPQALWLPSSFMLKDEDVERVCDAVVAFMKQGSKK